jgi:tetraacyldisaccharide 4'-kinase
MAEREDNFTKRVMSGHGGPAGLLLRGALRIAEPFYAGAMKARNKAFDSGKKEVADLGRPVISIGNITSGGTGKTPTVRWLCERLLSNGVRPAVLMRGYKSKDTGGSDEQRMLDAFLGGRGVIVEANPDRVAGSKAALAKAPDIGAFVLDDGFQHRRVKRDLDIVLINAFEPFGYGHVLPRGLLREPLAGLKRAGAFVITHARSIDEAALEAIRKRLIDVNPDAPIYCADHAPVGFRTPATPPSKQVDRFDEQLEDQPVLAFCGLASPRAFHEQLTKMRVRVVTHRWFKDHHAYTAKDLEDLYEQALAAGARVMVTTEKDWVKLQTLPPREAAPPIWRLDVVMRFWFSQETELLDQVRAVLPKK